MNPRMNMHKHFKNELIRRIKKDITLSFICFTRALHTTIKSIGIP